MTPQYCASLLILKPTSDPRLTQVLLTEQETLPQIATPPHFWQTCDLVNEGIYVTFGLEVVTLRCLTINYIEDTSTVVLTYLLEYQSGDPLSGRWQSIDRLDASLRHVVADTLEPPSRRAVWYRLGWSQHIHGLFPTAHCQQVRSWERSSVWRIHQDDQTLYCKGMGQAFPYEGRLTRWLADQFPISLPQFMPHYDPQLLISQAYTGHSLDTVEVIETWEQALRDYAHLQIRLRASVMTLESLGVPKRSMQWFESIAVQLLDDEAALQSGTIPLTDTEIDAVRAAWPRLRAEIRALGDWITLEHGDLWPGQIFVQSNQSIIFTDWSDSALTHPFLTLPFFMHDLPPAITGINNHRQRLIDAYLAPFLDEISADQGQQWLNGAFLLSPLYTAARYYADILPLMEQPWEMANNIAYNLRQMLQGV